jgi:hypothetical protein
MSPDGLPTPNEITGPRFPGRVLTAGIIWIVLGALILINAAIVLLLGTPLVAETGTRPIFGTAACSGIVLALFGAAFLLVGVQSVTGTALDMLGNGLGSIIIALFSGVMGYLMVHYQPVQAILAFLDSCGLIAAGVLALMGREDYKAWRKTRPG